MAVKIRSAPAPVRPARSTGAIYARFDQDGPATKQQHPFLRPELEEESESETEHCFETYASDYEEAIEESAGGDSASEGNGSTADDPEDALDDEGDAYDCEYYEIPCRKPRLTMFRHRNGNQRQHMPCPLLVEEEYLEE